MCAQGGCTDFLLGVQTQTVGHGQRGRAQLAAKNREVHRREEQRSHGFPTGLGELLPAYKYEVSPILETGPQTLKKTDEDFSSKTDTVIGS